jgi:hypothetical protein
MLQGYSHPHEPDVGVVTFAIEELAILAKSYKVGLVTDSEAIHLLRTRGLDEYADALQQIPRDGWNEKLGITMLIDAMFKEYEKNTGKDMSSEGYHDTIIGLKKEGRIPKWMRLVEKIITGEEELHYKSYLILFVTASATALAAFHSRDAVMVAAILSVVVNLMYNWKKFPSAPMIDKVVGGHQHGSRTCAAFRTLKSLDPEMMVGNMAMGWIVKSLQNGQNLRYIVDNLPRVSSEHARSGCMSNGEILTVAAVATAVLAVVAAVYSRSRGDSGSFKRCISNADEYGDVLAKSMMMMRGKKGLALWSPWYDLKDANKAAGKNDDASRAAEDALEAKIKKDQDRMNREYHLKMAELNQVVTNDKIKCYTTPGHPKDDEYRALKALRNGSNFEAVKMRKEALRALGGVVGGAPSTLHFVFVVVIILIMCLAVATFNRTCYGSSIGCRKLCC